MPGHHAGAPQPEIVPEICLPNFVQLLTAQTGNQGPEMVTATTKLKDACSSEESYDKPRRHIQKQRHHFVDKRLFNQSYGSHVKDVKRTIKKAEC